MHAGESHATLPRRLLEWAIIAALAALSFHLFVRDAVPYAMRDLSVFHRAGIRLGEGLDIYNHVYETADDRGNTVTLYYFYTPIVALIFSYLAEIPLAQVKMGFALLSYLCLLGSACVAVGLLEASRFGSVPRRTRLAAVLFLFVCFDPIYWGVREGQVHLVLLFLLSVFAFGTLRGLQTLSGAVLAAAIVLKMSPVVLLVVPLALRQWKCLASCAGVIAISGLWLFLAVPGTAPYAGFFSPFGPLLAGTLERQYTYNYAFDRVVLNLIGFDHVVMLRYLLRGALMALPAWAVVELWRGRSPASALVGTSLCMMIVAAPTLWIHHMTWTLVPWLIYVMRPLPANGSVPRDVEYRRGFVSLLLFMALGQANTIHHWLRAYGELPAAFAQIVPSFATIALAVGILAGSRACGHETGSVA